MEFLFDDYNPLDESWDLETELFELFCEMTDEEKNALLELKDLPECVYEAIAKTFNNAAA